MAAWAGDTNSASDEYILIENSGWVITLLRHCLTRHKGFFYSAPGTPSGSSAGMRRVTVVPSCSRLSTDRP